MITSVMNNSARRAFLIIGIPFVTTLLLLVGAVVFRIPGAAPFLSAHAASMQTTCATAPNTQKAHLCNGQDPIAQGCVPTAQTLQSANITDSTGLTIGRIDRRYSAQCNSYWARILDYRLPQPQHAVLAARMGGQESSATNTYEVYTNMIYVQPNSAPPHVEGTLDANADGSFTSQNATALPDNDLLSPIGPK